MSKKTIDCRGEICPKPLIMTKKALNDLKQNDALLVLVDNSSAKENVERFLKDNGFEVEVSNKENDFEIHVKVSEYCPVVTHKFDKDNHVVVISNNEMGQGPKELTQLLIQGFVNTLKEVSPLPSSIVFYTNGIFLALEDSPVLSSLRELETRGVKIIICGTCLNYFEVKEKLAVGQVSNMLTILETITHASRVVTP